MLVLSRQRDESIRIGHDIEITIVDIRGDKVRLGITAPREVDVHREEIYQAIQAEGRRQARADGQPEGSSDGPAAGSRADQPGEGEQPAGAERVVGAGPRARPAR